MASKITQGRKKATAPKVNTKHTYYVVAIESPKKVTGIIGPLDIYTVHLLLENGTSPPQENTRPDTEDQITWYRTHLETQEIFTLGGHSMDSTSSIVYVDTGKTNIDEFTNVRGLKEEELAGTIAWRSFIIPCHAGTAKEAIGFWVCAQKEMIGSIPLTTILTDALSTVNVPVPVPV